MRAPSLQGADEVRTLTHTRPRALPAQARHRIAMPSLSFGLLAAPLLSSIFPAVDGLPSGRPVHARDAFTRLGCFTDTDAGHRALAANFKGDEAMTVEICAEYCSAYQFFGTAATSAMPAP